MSSEDEQLQPECAAEPTPEPGRLRKLFRRVYGPRRDYYLTRWLFLRLLALVYLAAFLSYWMQVDGLIGHNGILPADGTAERLAQLLGAQRFWRLPTLFWLYPHDPMLHLLCGGGVLFSLTLLIGLLPPLSLFFLWVFYLSLVSVSQDFLSFQWDSLLLETGFMAMFLGPFQVLPRLSKQAAPSPIVLGLLRWVLFRLMFGSGFVKLGDATWRTFAALSYHFETQPLPTPLAWYAHHLPAGFLHFATAATLFIELIVPFLIVAPRRLRIAAFFPLVGLQLLIMLTGNFAFFNWLAIALCVLLLDDDVLRRVMPKKLSVRLQCPASTPVQRRYRRIGASVLAYLFVLLSLLQMARVMDRGFQPPGLLRPVAQALEPLRLVNPYGLFAVMTTVRPEIVIEGSRDGNLWLPYEFRYKPGDLAKAPRWVAPHQPRLDWQMWFAAMGPPYQSPWTGNLAVRLLQGSPEVLSLFEKNPFPGTPPKYLRATLYQYTFTRSEGGKTPREWWKREELGPYFPRMSLGVPSAAEQP
jgi:hypothetical protein